MQNVRRIVLTTLVCAAAAGGAMVLLRNSAPEGHTVSSTASPLSPREEFLKTAERLDKSTNAFIGRGSIDELNAILPASSVEMTGGRALRSQLASEHLRMGEIDQAIALLDEAILVLERDSTGIAREANLYCARGLAHLRRAEIENCIRRHNRDCCIAPLQKGGIHVVSEPARQAAKDYIRFLELTEDVDVTRDAAVTRPAAGAKSDMAYASVGGASPDSTAAQRMTAMWLLNIASMAVGEYPEGVPAAYRIPESAFGGKGHIGQFFDIAPQLGVDAFDHAGGAIVDDFDGDGRLDIVSSTCAPAGAMKAFRNRGHGTFEDVAAAWKLDEQLGGLHIAGGDYDNDGDLDIIVPRGAWMYEDGRIRKSLLRNDGPSGFSDVTRAAGLASPASPTQTVVWADFDNDGWLDLYVGHESRVETVSGGASHPSQLFHNNRDGTFTNIADRAGVRNDRYAKGVAAGDYDNDGDMDLYVSNIGQNRLYRNDGNLTFTDVAPELDLIHPTKRSFACWFFDFDNDGNLDLWVNAYDASAADVAWSAMGKPHHGVPPCLYRNNGDGTFTDIAMKSGIGKAWLPMGASFGDFDNDGWLDVYLGTGDPDYETLHPNVALWNDRGRRFLDVTKSAGLGHLQKGHEVCFADLDDDGDQDIYHQLGGFYPGDAFRNAFFLNPGHGNHFVAIELIGVRTNRAGVGARIKLTLTTTHGTRTVHRSAGSVSSFGQAPRRQEIGLGNATSIDAIEIWWPVSGARQVFRNVPLDTFLRITEGENDPELLPKTPIDFQSKAEVASSP